MERDEDLRVGRFGFDERVHFVVEADEVARVVGMRVHVGVDLGCETEIARMKCARDPQCVIAIRASHVRVGEVRFPVRGQADELAAVESIERVDDEDIFKIVLIRQLYLVDEVGARLRFCFSSVDEVFPCGVLLDQHKVAVLTHVFVELEDAVERRFGRGGEESVGCVA